MSEMQIPPATPSPSVPRPSTPPGAKLVGGVWLPETEIHFVEWMENSKRARVVEGKRTYQYHKLEAALRHQPPERRRVCLDIGAHVGLWAMWLVREFALVRSFEPVPAFAEIYPFNVDMAKARLHRVALGREARSVTITVPLDQTGNAHVSIAGHHPGTRYGNREEIDLWHAVPMRTLDSFGFEDVDFIKIDVEGLERAVVEGGERTIRTWRPNIVVEQKGNEAAYGEPRDAALTLLKSWGMKPLEVLSGDWVMGW